MPSSPTRGQCQVCGGEFNLTANGRIRTHGPKDNRCVGGSDLPATTNAGEQAGTDLPVLGDEGPNPHREPVTDAQMRAGQNGTERVLVHGNAPTIEWANYRAREREYAITQLGGEVTPEAFQEAAELLVTGDREAYGLPTLRVMAGDPTRLPLASRLKVDEVRRAWASTGAGWWRDHTPPADPDLVQDPAVYGPASDLRADTPDEARHRAKLVANGNSPSMVRELMGDSDRESETTGFPPLTAADMVGAARENNDQFAVVIGRPLPGMDTGTIVPAPGATVTGYSLPPQPTQLAGTADSTAPGTYVAHLRPGPDPDKDFDQWGRYKIWDAQAGKSVGRQRVTTFAKSISDQFGLGEWQQRKLLAGALMYPHLAEPARSMIGTGSVDLDVKTHAKAINSVVDAVKTAAGDKVRAELGTAVHRLTELYDLGKLTEADVPVQVAPDLLAYARTMQNAGLYALPDMVERTTISRAPDVAGTLDRVLRLPNGDHVIGDVKTGSDLTYAWLDIGIQLTCYAHGINENGVWEWDPNVPERGRWLPAPKVRTDFAIVMHMPAGTGTCTLYRVDLDEGWKNAALAVQVRAARKVRTHAVVLDTGGPEFQPVMRTAVAGQPLPEAPASSYAPGAVALQVQAPTQSFTHGQADTVAAGDEMRRQAVEAMNAAPSREIAAQIWAQASNWFPAGDPVFPALQAAGARWV